CTRAHAAARHDTSTRWRQCIRCRWHQRACHPRAGASRARCKAAVIARAVPSRAVREERSIHAQACLRIRRAAACWRGCGRRRAHYLEHRAALVASDASALIDELTRIADGARNTRVSAHSPPVCFVFSGQGTQWSGMALGLREADRTFAAELQRIDEAFAAAGSIRPIEELERVGPTSRLERTDVAQVCLFAVQAALLNVLEQRGIRPSVVMGHSAGELAAAYAAGMLTLEAA